MSKPVILILGAGANVGLATAELFASKGWSVVAASRSPKDEIKAVARLSLSVDFSDPSTLKPAFERCVAEVGAPSVVVFNAYTITLTRKSHPFTLEPAAVQRDMAVNVQAPYEAMRLSIELWRAAPQFGAGSPATPAFLFTGNMMTTQLHPLGLTLGMGKNAVAYALETAAAVYGGAQRFYFVDERTPQLESVYGAIDGPAHAAQFWELAHAKEQGQWCCTFVKGTGHVPVSNFVNRDLRTDLDVPGFD